MADKNKEITNLLRNIPTNGGAMDIPTNGNSDQNSKTESTKKENKDKMYRVSPAKNGNYYVVESSYDGGKTWHFVDSSPDQEMANRIKKIWKKV